jgi:hypothetical protein
MKTLKKVPISYKEVPEFMPEFETMEEGVLYVSHQYHTAIHRCLCGCGEKIVTPIGHERGGWTLNLDNGVTMTPSIGNYQLPCKSHYIITKGVANFV